MSGVAQLLLAKSAKLGPPAVPAYVVDGLVLTKRGKEIRPVFLAKKDCDAALANLGEEGKTAKVTVLDALTLLVDISEDIEAVCAAPTPRPPQPATSQPPHPPRSSSDRSALTHTALTSCDRPPHALC